MPSPIRKVRIDYIDREPVEVALTPKVQVKFEEHFNISLVDFGRVSHIYWLAWAAATNAGQETRDYETFLDSIADVTPVMEVADNGTRPTLVAQ